jgi:hypothetical protein
MPWSKRHTGKRLQLTENLELCYSNDSLIFTNVACLRGINNEKSKSGIITINLEHCPPDMLNHINIKYSDSELEKLVDQNRLL